MGFIESIWNCGEHTITVLNKVSAVDSEDGMDHWYSHVISNCVWKEQSNTVQQDTENRLTLSITCRIPQQEHYREYLEFISNPQTYFTLNPNDYIVLGQLEQGEIEDVLDIVQKYKHMQISTVVNNCCAGFLEHYRVEGV